MSPFQGQPLIVQLAATDSDLANEGDHLTFRVRRTSNSHMGRLYQVQSGNISRGEEIWLPAPGNTAVVTNPSGLLRFDPDPDACGQLFLFLYDAVDQYGLPSAEGQVAIDILPVNDPPHATPTTSVGFNDAPSCVVILNYGDVDGGPLTLCITQFPTRGKLYAADGEPITRASGCLVSSSNSLLYVKDDPAGLDSYYETLSYTVTDASGLSASSDGNVIDIQYRNLPPELVSPALVECAEDAIDCDVALTGWDPDNDRVMITLDSLPAHGKLYWNSIPITAAPAAFPEYSSTMLRYVPDADFNTRGSSPDSFNVTLSDEQGGTHSAAISLVVHAVNDAPGVSCPAWIAGELSIIDASLVAPAIIRTAVVSDRDADGGLVMMTITADERSTGQLVLTVTDGLSNVQLIDSRHIEFQGTLAAVNTAFDANHVQYLPTADDEVPVITSTVNDQGNSGEGSPSPLTASGQTTVTVWYVN
jgi:hypothetical protein